GGRGGLLPPFFLKIDFSGRGEAGVAVTSPLRNVIKNKTKFIIPYAPRGGETGAYSVDINPSLAYRVSDRLSIGAGVSAQWLQIIFSDHINQAALFGVPGIPDGVDRAKGDDWSFGYNLGILAEPWDGTRIGLAYRSKV